MKGDPKVVEYLNKALRHELTAVNKYWLHYRMLENWGYKVLAKKWRAESIDEMQHADKLIDRIIFLDGSPNMQTLESLHIGKMISRSSTTIYRRRYQRAGSTPKPQPIAIQSKIT